MAESIVKDFKGKADWVYVGKAEAPKHIEKKADTLFNEYMQKVFDVAYPVAVYERRDAARTQAAIAEKTAEQLVGDAMPKEKKGRSRADIEREFIDKWLAMEQKASNPDHQNRLGKLLTAATYMAGSLGLNYGSELIANSLYRGRQDIPLPFGKSISLKDETGNKRMLNAGWEYLTDVGIEKMTDWSVKKLASREDIGFVSPLSRAIGKMGNTIMNVSGGLDRHDPKTQLIKSVLNPGFIEGAFRFTGAIPGLGFIKEFYGSANQQVMKGEGIIPMGADLAFNMIFAKLSAPVVKGESGGQSLDNMRGKAYSQ